MTFDKEKDKRKKREKKKKREGGRKKERKRGGKEGGRKGQQEALMGKPDPHLPAPLLPCCCSLVEPRALLGQGPEWMKMPAEGVAEKEQQALKLS